MASDCNKTISFIKVDLLRAIPTMALNHLISCHGEVHVAMVVSFVVFDFACGGLGLLS